jgi:hypothetical protein
MLQRFQPVFDMPLADIKRSDVIRILDGIIAEGKPYRANRVFSHGRWIAALSKFTQSSA